MKYLLFLFCLLTLSLYSCGERSQEKTSEVNEIVYDADSHTIKCGEYEYKFQLVEGGTFVMGEGGEDIKSRRENAIVPHEVMLSSFFIGATEVPQWLWTAVMESNPSKFKGSTLPVERVSWDDCKDFIIKLNIQTGEKFNLPTEAQWEYAAIGGKKSKHTKYSGSDDIDSVGWYNKNSGNKTHPVGEKTPNPLGLYDMSGNVYEWCLDYYGDYSGDKDYDPTGPVKGKGRIRRGGSYNLAPKQSMCVIRGHSKDGQKGEYIGLRLVLPYF